MPSNDEIDRAPITEDQFAFMEEFTASFQRAIEHVLWNPPKDQFDDMLSDWAIHLGILAHDVLGSLIALLRLGRVRSAYMLQRPLLDYHLRLRYYVKQSEEPKKKWIAKGRRSLKNYLQQCHAYKDWRNAEDKVYDVIAKRGPSIRGLDELPDDLKQSVTKKLTKKKEILTRRTWEMCKAAEDPTYGSFYLENQVLSAHLHGDQMAIIDTMRRDGPSGDLRLRWETESLKAYPILGNAYIYCYEFLCSIEMFRGWSYAKDGSYAQAFRRLYRRKND